jgi:predicted acyltransferase
LLELSYVEFVVRLNSWRVSSPTVGGSVENRLSVCSPQSSVAEKGPQRLVSLDAFRGFTISGMIFVIMVAGYKNLPQTFPAFGSAPVSTWKHAGEDDDSKEWANWNGARTYKLAQVVRVQSHGKYEVAIGDTTAGDQFYHDVAIRHCKPLQSGEQIIAVFPKGGGDPKFQGIGNGCTFTDLIAPFFVFIVGVAIPLSRRRRGAEWWKHVGTRTLLLIGLGVLYIALALKGITWWWGILQAIGVAYFMGAAFLLLPPVARWGALAALVAAHALLSWFVPWWTHLPADASHGFFTLSNLSGDKLAPLNVHCTPWGSVGYGIITIVGTFVGEVLVTREQNQILRKCLTVGLVCAGLGYAIHRFGIPMNKSNVSISYSLFTAGMAGLCFLLFYWAIDVKGFKAWATPLNVFGTNPLLGYFLQVLVRMFLATVGLYSFFTGHRGWSGMGWALLWTALLWCVCLYCNKRKIYWRV